MQVSQKNFIMLAWTDALRFIWEKNSLCNSYFLKDFQPHPDPDSGASHGQLNLSSDQEMWPELYVSSAEA